MAKTLFISLCLIFSIMAAEGFSAQPGPDAPAPQEQPAETAPVVIDDTVLFHVRGIEAFPAEERARGVGERIRKIASDPTIRTDSIAAVESEYSTDIKAGDKHIVSILDADAAEGVPRQLLAKGYVGRLQTAIEKYRKDRSPESILRGVVYSLLATIGVVVALLILRRLFRKLYSVLESRYKARIHALHIKSLEIMQAERVWKMITGGLRAIRIILILLSLYIYLYLVLGSFPWTRHLAANLLGYVLMPLQSIGKSIIKHMPNLFFIAILVIVTRYALKIMRLFFTSVEKGAVTLSGFDPEWARPTYKIVRLFVVAFAAVIAYPYIPGSESPAFKGISLFLGVVFSLGSSSAISNIIAGYTMTYRRAFKVGDRVKIDDFTGDVSEVRLQVTHLRTVKNEEVIVPNSLILNSHIVNYSTFAREPGLILHTTVTIGYDVPWRQVTGMLLTAAERTQGVLKEPKPFVLQKSLDDFYVTYELNVYTDTPQGMALTYSELHQQILDAFNEHGVQIMSPAYESDPDKPKVVPKERWYEPPSLPPGEERA